MRKLRAMWIRLFGSLRRDGAEADFAAEMESHLALHTEDGMRSGLTRVEARRQASVRLGGVEQAKQAYREQRISPGFEGLLQDARYSIRQLYKSPGFSLIAVVTLALAIGANTAIFSIVNAILLHPSGVDHPERVAVLNVRYAKYTLDVPYTSTFVYSVAASTKDLVETAGIERAVSFNIASDGRVEHVAAAQVSRQWFQVFGAKPILGRTFTSEEDQPNASPVAVLSYGLWQRSFGGRSDVIGQSLLLDQKYYRVVGIMRSDFRWPRGYELWTPIGLPPSASNPKEAFNENYHAVIRLLPGVSLEHFNAMLGIRLNQELLRSGGMPFASSSGWMVYASPLTNFAAGPLRKPIYVLFGVVALVLFIASANVAGLLLARSSSRSKEFALRVALGASILRLGQQLLIEAALLVLVAALLGVASGPFLGRLLLLLLPHHLAEGFTVQLDPFVLAFTGCAALLTCLIAGLTPAFRLAVLRTRLQLTENDRGGTTSLEKQRLRSYFVIGEIALSFLLLTGTGLFLVSLRHLQQTDAGFDSRGVVAARVDYAGGDLKQSQSRQADFIRGTLEALAGQPQVQAAAAVQPLPFAPDALSSDSFDIQGRPVGPNDPGPHSHLTYTTPDFLKVMRIPLLAGRWLNVEDRKDAPRVVVIDERLAHRYWQNQSPVGKHLDSEPGNNWATVVGVVSNIRSESLEEDTTDGMRYYPFAQVQDATVNFVVRTRSEPEQMAAVFKSAVSSTDPTQTVTTVTSLETLVYDSLAGRRLIVWLLAAFAGLALLLAMLGIYGLISYLTVQRATEIGIRMALGARRVDVVLLVVKSAMTWIVAGLAGGAILSVASTVVLRHAFPMFGAGAATSLALAGSLLILIGFLACLIPAKRVASIDPMKALRAE